jgi:hypothetical protein
MIKNLLKSKVNPTEIKGRITPLKLLRDGRVMIQASSKNEIETVGDKIGEKCGEELEVNIKKLRNTRLVLLNIPEDITLENVEETLTIQNPELDLKEEDIRAKFCYTTKRETRNLVIEADSGTRTKLMQARIKLGWAICRVDDYLSTESIRMKTEVSKGCPQVSCCGPGFWNIQYNSLLNLNFTGWTKAVALSMI